MNPLQLHKRIQFSERLNEVHLWISKARELLFAADCLRSEVTSQWSKVKIEKDRIIESSRDPNVQGIYFMLIAYAVENLCKAILIHQRQEDLKHRLLSKVPNYIKGHDLLKLACDIKMELNTSEQKLLARLSRNSIWSARYPIPIEASSMRTSEKLLGGQNCFSAYFGPNDIPQIDNFLKELRKIARNELNVDI